MLRRILFAVTLLSLLASSSTTRADLVLDLQPVGSTTVASGGTVDVQLVLRDTDGSHFGTTSGLGLLSGGGKLVEVVDGGANLMVTGSALGADFPLGSPNFANSLVDPGIANVLSSINLIGVPSPAGIVSGIAHIATFTLEVTGNGGDFITIGSDILGAATGGGTIDGNVIFGGGSIDGDVTFDALTLSVSGAVIPEPSSLLLAGLFAGGGIVAIRRRRRQSVEG
ncbi:MAG: PEP-CTERM sorting domain-containing protein [Planctomycetaceae bacterium]|nr:PEP-CTERM sorting domain-containing protein [Planctomycetaceae bacterium]